ncbi:phosphohistidine phosphatase SixA [Aquisphaera insulae]|uniref:phosphohistidine phosphatase SixA n=1 Tax=Aquisphaera insulae TaxID=2712864 RepID=UPI0013ECC811|nr:phosphohistidine phosphatase SixA [Aquisphaera insulae]
MQTLYLLRHGIAVPHGTPGIDDDDRPLTTKGEHRSRQVGAGFAAYGPTIDRIVSSPLPRAIRTAEVVAEELGLAGCVETADALAAGRSPQEIRDWLRGRSEEHLMLVGHNPALSELVGLLIVGEPHRFSFELKKAAMAALFRGPDPSSRYELLWTAPPRILRRLGH